MANITNCLFSNLNKIFLVTFEKKLENISLRWRKDSPNLNLFQQQHVTFPFQSYFNAIRMFINENKQKNS